jgi:hypothetical protein
MHIYLSASHGTFLFLSQDDDDEDGSDHDDYVKDGFVVDEVEDHVVRTFKESVANSG